MKKSMLPLAMLALIACPGSHAADGRGYEKQSVKMDCGTARYTLTSTCIQSGDLTTLNECKPQTLSVDNAGAKRSTTLPELPKALSAEIRAARGGLGELFVISWACSKTGAGPIATLHYSIGGGSAAYGEAWANYDKAGNLIVKDLKLTPDEIDAIQRNLKRVPSIMPE